MHDSVQSLLENGLDYAGLFPPSRLPMHDAMATYQELQSSPQSWFLGRFVVPSGRLHELEDALENTTPTAPVPLSMIGQPSHDAPGLRTAMGEDATLLQHLMDRHPGQFTIDQIETWLPECLVSGRSATAVAGPVEQALRQVHTEAPVTVFFETSLLEGWPSRLGIAIDGLTAANGATRAAVGLKIRCGGLTAEQFPSTEAVATAISKASAARLPIKATQGLHRPLRHFDEQLGVWRHGFLNIFVAAVLAFVHRPSTQIIAEILEVTNISGIHWTERGIECYGLTADRGQIRAARHNAIVAYGSCSFSEPVADLEALGLISEPAAEGVTA